MRQREEAKRATLAEKHCPVSAIRNLFTTRHHHLFTERVLLLRKYLGQVFKICYLPFMRTMIQASRANGGFLI